jgi:tRNA pseudouridine55 synthase
MTQDTSGVLVVDKPPGPTSHTIVAQVRKITGLKTGHLGTLDPAATGVLPLVLGRATRLAQFLQPSEKEYLATIRLGSSTDTYDAEGQVVSEGPVPTITRERIEEVVGQFEGKIDQLPPMFSAVKVKGERLYRAARRGEIRERPTRTVVIFELVLLDWEVDRWRLRIKCSAGTYIRTLAHDMGQFLGCGAHLERLCRTRSGSFSLSSALSIDEVGDRWESALIPVDKLLLEFPAMQLDETQAEAVSHGNRIVVESDPGHELCRLFHSGHLLAIGRVGGDYISPKVVLRPAS